MGLLSREDDWKEGCSHNFFSSLKKVGVRAVFIFRLTAKGVRQKCFFRSANNMRGAGAAGAGGRCLRNYILILRGLIIIIFLHVSIIAYHVLL